MRAFHTACRVEFGIWLAVFATKTSGGFESGRNED